MLLLRLFSLSYCIGMEQKTQLTFVEGVRGCVCVFLKKLYFDKSVLYLEFTCLYTCVSVLKSVSRLCVCVFIHCSQLHVLLSYTVSVFCDFMNDCTFVSFMWMCIFLPQPTSLPPIFLPALFLLLYKKAGPGKQAWGMSWAPECAPRGQHEHETLRGRVCVFVYEQSRVCYYCCNC